MDNERLRKLAGTNEGIMQELNESIKELDLLEKMYQGRNNLGIDTDQMSIEEIQKRMDAASRALGIANRLRDPAYKKQHLSRIMSNMNTIRAALKYMIAHADDGAEQPRM